MNLKNLSDDDLHRALLGFVNDERRALIYILHHFLEVERRRLYSDYRCTSLFNYSMKLLKYSEPQTNRRISAMRLLRDVPNIDGKIRDGSLSLTNLNLAQSYFSAQEKAGKECNREEFLSRLENKTKAEAEKIIYAASPEMKKRDLNLSMIKDEELRKKLLRVKGKYAHSHPDMTLTDLLHLLCDNELKSPSPAKVSKLHAEVRQRDGHACTNCGSTHALEVDHIIPAAKGGPTILENLRLLCRNCNQRAAIHEYGQEHMSNFLKSRVRERCVDH